MFKRALSAVGAVALVIALGTTSGLAAGSGNGSGGGGAGGGGGGGGGGGEEGVANSLSVPAVFVGTTIAPFTCATTTATLPSGTTMTFPRDFDLPLETQEDGTATPAGDYYIQGQATWQADCANAADNTVSATGDWGDNLGGSASLRVGAPVRVEMGLLVDTTVNTDYAEMQGFKVLKLTDELDRDATYGTLGTLENLGEVRAYDDGASWTITGPDGTISPAISAEVNATGRVVYGYNWSPAVAGDYTITFKTTAVTLLNGSDSHTISINVTVKATSGGGGGGEGGGGGGGGGEGDVAPAITSGGSASFTVGSAGSFTVTASGSPTPTLSVSGTLPSGVTFTDNGNGTGTLSGTPTAAGTTTITLTASNSVSSVDQVFTLTVSASSSDGGGGTVILPAPTNTYPGGNYTSLTPTRILDSRMSSPLGAGATFNLPVAGQGGVPVGATGVVLNVTAVNPTAAGFLTVFPAGVTMPTASSLNFKAGQVVANQVTVPLGTGGAISIYNSAGSTDVVVDVAGYYSSSAGEGYVSLTPTRIEDTRTDDQELGAGETITIPMPDSVPANATGVVLNVTATDTTSPGYLTVYPNEGSRPLASNLNFSFAGETVANRVHVKLANRAITIYNFAGNAQVVVDLNGYFAAGGATFTGAVPTRVEDTRNDGHTARTNGTLSLNVSGSGNLAGVPAGAKAVVLNVTAVNPTMSGYLTVSPGSDGHPLASDLNFLPGQTVANQVVVGVGNGAINFYNSSGDTDVCVDVVGWYV